MASQSSSVLRDPRLVQNQESLLQARMQFLPQIMANQASKKIEAKQDAQFEQTMALEQDKFALQKKRDKAALRMSEASMGMEAAKLGTSLAFSNFGKQNVGQMIGKTGGIFGGGSPGNKPGVIGGLNLGNMISSGLVGYGVGNMVGGSKKKRVLGGALGGGLMGLISNSSDSLLGAGLNFGTGAVLGGLGGYL